jgi:flagellar basal-body rod modification protein FlgD
MSSISPVNPLTPTAPLTPGAAAAKTAGGLTDPQTFLKLLVAELKYQDPSNPTDPTQFLAQTAQFSMVQTLNTVGSDMAEMLTASQQAAAAALIGRQVTGTTSAGASVTGVVTGMQTSTSGTSLEIGSDTVPLANVTSVSAAATGSSTAAPATTPAPATTSNPTSTTSPGSTTTPSTTPTNTPTPTTTPAPTTATPSTSGATTPTTTPA